MATRSRKNGEISCIERVPARDGWPAGIAMLLMHLDGSPLAVLDGFAGRLKIKRQRNR